MGSCLSTKSTTTIPLPDPPQIQPKSHNLVIDDTLKKKSVFLIKHEAERTQTHKEFHVTDPPGTERRGRLSRNSSGTRFKNLSFDLGNKGKEIDSGDEYETNKLGRHVFDPLEAGGRGRLSRNSSARKERNRSVDLGNGQRLICDKGKEIESGDEYEGDDVSLGSRRNGEFGSRVKKRSFDFDDKTLEGQKDDLLNGGDEMSIADRISRHRRSRSSSSAGRRRSPRVSRSPSRRSESPVSGTTSASSNLGANNTNNNNVSTNNKPGKMVSVPASEHTVKRISVRRNVGDPSVMARNGSSPRARSPAKQALSLSRNGSKRAEYSPYRRNALGDIDQNCSRNYLEVSYQKTNGENLKSNQAITQVPHSGPLRSIANDEYQMYSRSEESEPVTPQKAMRTEQSRVEKLRKQPSSYTALLLEDIQNFHQKSATSAISLPPCVSKAQSIVDAVADLNSGTKSNFHATKNSTPVPFNRATENYISHISGDLADPRFDKYVTVKRGTMEMDEEDEEEESSGSNSFVSGNQHWVSSSSWEPNSSDSTEHCTSSSRSKGNNTQFSSELDQKRSGIGRYRVGSGISL